MVSAYYLLLIQNNVSTIPKPMIETCIPSHRKNSHLENSEISWVNQKYTNTNKNIQRIEINSHIVENHNKRENTNQTVQIDLQRANFHKYDISHF